MPSAMKPASRPMNAKLTNTQQAGQTRELLDPVLPTHRQKWTNYIVGFALGITAVALGIIIFWGLTGKDVLEIHNAPVPVRPAYVKNDEKITVSIDFCKKVKSEGTIYTRFVSDKTELVVPTTKENLGTGCYKDLEFQVPIPPQLTADTYHLNYRIDYQTNPITHVREEFNTQEFTVTR